MEPASIHRGEMRVDRWRRHGPSVCTALDSAPRASRPGALTLRAGPCSPPQNPDAQTYARRGEDGKFMKRHCETFREVATAPGRAALDHATTHWPDYPDSHWPEPCDVLLQQDTSPDVASAHTSARRTFTRTPNVGPAQGAVAASGALPPRRRDTFARVEKTGTLKRPAWARPTRYENFLNAGLPPFVPIGGARQRVRVLKPESATNYIQRVDATPPAVLRSSLGETTNFPRAPL